MQSKKRFRETFVWDADWYMRLDLSEKLFWSYLNDHCDNIGVWEPNIRLAEFHIGSEIDVSQFFQRVNKGTDRLIKRPDGSWLLPGFVKFQYARSKPLNPKSPAHRSYLELMKERNLWEWFMENYPEVMEEAVSSDEIENPKRGLKEFSESNKDKDKETDTDKAKDKDKDTPRQDVDNALDFKSSLHYFNIVKALKKIIPVRARTDLTDEVMEADVKTYYTVLQNNDIDRPKSYIIAKAKSADWKENEWDDFDKILTNGTPAEVEV